MSYVYDLKISTPVVATDNNNAVTGNQSTKWAGITISEVGVRGNVAAGNGLCSSNVYDTTKTLTHITKYARLFLPTLTAATNNYVVCSASHLAFSSNVTIYEMQATCIERTDDFITSEAVLSTIKIHYRKTYKDFIVFIPQAQVANLTDQILVIKIAYR